jgi:hypothetical protein
MAKRNFQPRPRGRPPIMELTGAGLLRRFRHKTLVWCDENGEPVNDQAVPTGYVRPVTKTEGKRLAQIAHINEVLGGSSEFERCDADGMPDPNGTHWKLRDNPVA